MPTDSSSSRLASATFFNISPFNCLSNTNNNDEFRTRTRRVPRNKLNGLLIFAISAFTISPQWS